MSAKADTRACIYAYMLIASGPNRDNSFGRSLTTVSKLRGGKKMIFIICFVFVRFVNNLICDYAQFILPSLVDNISVALGSADTSTVAEFCTPGRNPDVQTMPVLAWIFCANRTDDKTQP